MFGAPWCLSSRRRIITHEQFSCSFIASSAITYDLRPVARPAMIQAYNTLLWHSNYAGSRGVNNFEMPVSLRVCGTTKLGVCSVLSGAELYDKFDPRLPCILGPVGAVPLTSHTAEVRREDVREPWICRCRTWHGPQ